MSSHKFRSVHAKILMTKSNIINTLVGLISKFGFKVVSAYYFVDFVLDSLMCTE